MNVFDRGMAQLQDRLTKSASVPIVYYRQETNELLSIQISAAWFGRTMFKTTEDTNVRINITDRDFLIPVSSLVLSNQQWIPRESDWIIVPSQDNARYELFAPFGEPVWRYSDPQNTLYRIHTKRHNII